MIHELAYDAITTKLSNWLSYGVSLVPNIALAILILALSWLIGIGVKRLVRNAVRRASHSRSLTRLSGTFAMITVVLIGFFIALSVLNLGKTVTSLLAGVGILGLALGFAFQSIAANFIAGVVLAFEKPFDVGDLVQTNDHLGKVEQIHLRSTTIKTLDGQWVVLPNQEVLSQAIRNYDSGRRRIDLGVGVSYGDDLDLVEKVTREAAESVGSDVNVYFSEFGSSSINLICQIWLDETEQPHFNAKRSEAIKTIKKSYDENGITIPFPIRTLDFGIKGGKDLKKML